MLDFNELPKVSVVMIQTRTNGWFDKAKGSVNNQYYPNKELIIINNLDKKKTIGACWNEGVKRATGKYCLFIGDDDEIAPDYMMSLVINMLESNRKEKREGVTSFLTAFDEKENIKSPGSVYPTGMWSKEWLLKKPFDETLKKRVDAIYYKNEGKGRATIVSWNYGYFYRQHDDMISGRSLKKKDIEKIRQRNARQKVNN